ncbi:MAG: GAF domain-containing protein [Steroidobacteraceae bacterium]
MQELKSTAALDKPTAYQLLSDQLRTLISGESDWIANLANAAALLYHSLPDINWAGFYLLKAGELVLGPFQGKPACVRIAMGRGVCGTAAESRTTIVVPDVHDFAGHIACDSASNAEIVVPMMRGTELLGVLDVDSPAFARFDETDRLGLEAIVRTLIASA